MPTAAEAITIASAIDASATGVKRRWGVRLTVASGAAAAVVVALKDEGIGVSEPATLVRGITDEEPADRLLLIAVMLVGIWATWWLSPLIGIAYLTTLVVVHRRRHGTWPARWWATVIR